MLFLYKIKEKTVKTTL